MSDDVRRRLEDAGRRPVPPPDAGYAEALEARLRSVAASLPPAPPTPPRRRGTAGWRIAGAGAAVLVTAAVVVAIGIGGAGPSPSVGPVPPLVEPVNVVVALADGTVIEDPDGLLLPEGAVVTVGEGGSARIGGTELGPGDVARVRGGRLEIEHPGPVGVVPESPPDRTRSPGGTARPVTPAPTSSPPVPTPSPAPPQTASPAPTPDRTPAPTAPPPTARPTPTPTPVIVRPRLRARLITGPRIAVRWTATWGAAGYVLVATASRSGPAADPVYPGSRVIGEFVAPPEGAVRFRVPDGVVEVRLMVVALREDGRVLRRSRVVTIAVPPPGDTTGASPAPSDATATPPPVAPTPSPAP